MPEAPNETASQTGVQESTGSSARLANIEAAIQEVRREGRKVAVVYAILDAVLILLAANLVISHLGLEALAGKVGVPGVVSDLVGGVLGRDGDPGVAVSAVLAIFLGVIVFTVEYLVRVQRPLVEQFEAANPDLQVTLRTARDTAATSRESQMARRLYADVLDRLKDASSARLLDGARVGATMIAVVGLALLTVQTAAVDFDLAGLDAAGPNGVDSSDASSEYEGLQDGDSVLGDVEDVNAGDEELAAQVASSGGDHEPDGEHVGGYGAGDFSESGAGESQQSGYAPAEEIEEADLVREYNLRIRDDGT